MTSLLTVKWNRFLCTIGVGVDGGMLVGRLLTVMALVGIVGAFGDVGVGLREICGGGGLGVVVGVHAGSLLLSTVGEGLVSVLVVFVATVVRNCVVELG